MRSCNKSRSVREVGTTALEDKGRSSTKPQGTVCMVMRSQVG